MGSIYWLLGIAAGVLFILYSWRTYQLEKQIEKHYDLLNSYSRVVGDYADSQAELRRLKASIPKYTITKPKSPCKNGNCGIPKRVVKLMNK